MSEPIGCNRKLDRHERKSLPVVVGEPAAVVATAGPEIVQHAGVDDPRQEIVQHDILVVEADTLLHVLEGEAVIVVDHAVVEAQHQPLQLRHDAVLVVAGIADQRAALETRQIAGVGHAGTGQGFAEQELAAAVVHVGLIARTASVEIVQVERGRTEIDEAVRILLLGQQAHGIEGDVVIDELAEIGVERGNTALLSVGAVLGRIEIADHVVGECREVCDVVGVIGAEFRRRQIAEHAAKAALRQRRTGGVQTTGSNGVTAAHQ
jgi:hypothetical protein